MIFKLPKLIISTLMMYAGHMAYRRLLLLPLVFLGASAVFAAPHRHAESYFSPLQETEKQLVTGYVIDDYGAEFPGVNVFLNRSGKVTVTDADGFFRIQCSKGDTLSFSHVGYKTEKVVIGNNLTLEVVMNLTIRELEEVVLIGYGETKKTNVTIATSKVEGKTIETNLQSGATFDKSLDGLIKGVFVTQGGGELGNNADVIIRGVTSPFGTGNNNPLYVIDGVPIFVSANGEYQKASGENFNPLQTLNPNDIESIDILKDAAATSIYGSRGANGVIIVKTKSGSYEQPTSVSFSYRTSFGFPIKTLDYLDAEGFKNYILTMNKNSWAHHLSKADTNYNREVLERLPRFGFKRDEKGVITYDPSLVKFGNANTDWNKVVYRDPAVTKAVNARITGGGETVHYTLSIGHTNQEGILRADRLKKYNARLSTNFKVSETINAGMLVNYNNSKNTSGFSSTNVNTGGNYLGSTVLNFRPDLPVYDSRGRLTYENIGAADDPVYKVNPLGQTTLANPYQKIDNSLLGNVFAEFKPIEGLTLKAQYSLHLLFDKTKDFKPKEYAMEGYSKTGTSQLMTADVYMINQTIDYTGQYTRIFGKHTLTALAGYSFNKEKTESFIALYKGFLNSKIGRQPQDAKTTASKMNNIEPSALSSYFGRLSYEYKQKYALMASFRVDRSSKFAPRNRNAYFPSISASWNIHEEDFMKTELIENLKIRASYGFTGTTNVSAFSYIQLFSATRLPKYNGNISSTFDYEFANRKARWERTREYNFGIDFRLKKSILRGSLDVYDKRSIDVISSDRAVAEAGAESFSSNNATIQNRGFELALGSDIIYTKNFSWTIDVNASKNANKLVAVSKAVSEGSISYVVGREINLITGFLSEGIIQDQETIDKLNQVAKQKGYNHFDQAGTAPGDYLFKDINGDGRITESKDKAILGSRQPDLFGGFNTKVKYKGISLSTYFSYALGIQSVRAGEKFLGFFNVEKRMAPQYRWSPTNKSATLSRLIHRADDGVSRISSENVFDASYLRLTALRIGYELPLHIVNKIKLNNVNVYLSATNLYTWTSFPGIDPQNTNAGGGAPGSVENYDAYPSAKTFSVGINIRY